jgi:L-ascorbate metabolism protein UlaG (beta-lactamase superfamily)
MKITRFPQSCILLERDGQRIVIDPGEDFLKSHTIEELQGVKAVLYTHQHSDHFVAEISSALHEQGAALYANAATAKLIGTDDCTTVKSLDSFTVAGFAVVAYEIAHCLLPNGEPGPQNTGYVVDGVFFHPGDGKDMGELSLQVASMALPIAGPDISMLDAFTFAKQVGAQMAIPIHYDKLGANAEVYALFAERLQLPFKLQVLADGQSLEIPGAK